MRSRSSLLLLAVGLVVGTALGYAAGHRSAAPATPVPTATAPPPGTPPPAAPLSPAASRPNPGPLPFAGFKLPDTTPAGVSKGMTRARAVAVLTAGGFETWTDATVTDRYERFRKQWRGGYHFVTIQFDGDVVSEVNDLWNDP